MQQTTLRLKEAVSTSFHTSTKILANSVTKHHFRHKPRLIQVTNTQLSEPSDPHVVNMVEGGGTPRTHLSPTQKSSSIETFTWVLTSRPQSKKERCNSICASTQPSKDDIHNTNPEYSLHNRHKDGARPSTLSRVPPQTLPTASEKNSRLSGKISARTHHINQLVNILLSPNTFHTKNLLQ